jgi:hypothetical protein
VFVCLLIRDKITVFRVVRRRTEHDTPKRRYLTAGLYGFTCQKTGKPFTVSINIIRKRLSAIGKKKSVGPDDIPGQILKLGGEAMIPYLARLLEITMSNNAVPGDRKKAIAVPIYKGGDRSVVGKFRPISLSSVVCKQVEYVIAGT